MQAMQTLTDISTLIVQTPEVCGGRPRIAGHRITVQNIAINFNAGMKPEDILSEKPYLTLAEVYAALAYYYANQSVIDAAIAAEDAEFDRLEAEYKAQRQ
jgi:uncharacterized protein (DUF433 family)